MNQSKPTFLSLFCGCGGFDLGFFQADFQCLGAYDIDPIAVKTYNDNFKSKSVIKDLEKADIDASFDKEVDIIIAGPPCQGFSTVGKRNFHDPRNNLLLTAGRIALEIRPKVFVLENVRGVISGDHRQYWLNLKAMFSKNGYNSIDFLVNGEDHGLAQMRKRMLFIAWRTKIGWKPIDLLHERVILKDVLLNLNGIPNNIKHYLDSDSEFYLIAQHIKQGQKLCNVRGGERAIHTWNIPEVYGTITEDERIVLETLLKLRRQLRLRKNGDADPVLASSLINRLGSSVKLHLQALLVKGYIIKKGNRYDIAHAFNGKFRRLHWEELSYTVDTRFTDVRYFIHPTEDRGFTIREAARIQGFPDSFKFTGTEEEQIRLIGNAVPPPLAKWVALGVKKMII